MASFLSCWHNVQDTVYLMHNFGFSIHQNKSVLIPTQTISFVGFVLNSISTALCLTSEKTNNLIPFKIRAFAQSISKVVASQPGLFHAPLFSQQIWRLRKINKGIMMLKWF